MSTAEHFRQGTWKVFRLASKANGPKEIERYAEMVRRLTEFSATPLNANETIAPCPTKVPCPKCGRDMALKAVLPHPIIAGMKRHAYVCAPCDRARTYYQPSKPPQVGSLFHFRPERPAGAVRYRAVYNALPRMPSAADGSTSLLSTPDSTGGQNPSHRPNHTETV
jgi:hypothetical protein